MSSKKNRRKSRHDGGAASVGDGSEARAHPLEDGTGIHFTIGTGPHTDPQTGHLSLEHDARLVKTGLLYADRISLCSIGSSMTARMLAVAGADPDGQIDFLERHFTETIAKDDPDAAATALECLRQYRELRRKRNATREELQLRGQLMSEMRPLWQRFEQNWKSFARNAGVEEILAAERTGLVELHEFSAGGIEATGSLDPATADARSEEFFEAAALEVFQVLSRSVEEGTTMPLLDAEAGELVRLGIDAGEVRAGDSGSYRGRHAGLASGLLRRLPLFDAAPVDEVLGIRTELESPLMGFRGAMARLARTVRSEEWSPEFEAAIDEVIVREVEPAVAEIEEWIKSNRPLSRLANGAATAAATGPGMALATYHLGSLPELASMAVGAASGIAVGAGSVYEQWKKERADIRSREMFFYREAERLLDA